MAYKLPSPSMTDKRKYVVASAEWAETLSNQVKAFEARIEANRQRNRELVQLEKEHQDRMKRERAAAKRRAKSIANNIEAIARFKTAIKRTKQIIKERTN